MEEEKEKKRNEYQKLIEDLQEKGYLIEPEAVQMIKESENPDELIHKALKNTGDSLTIKAEDLKEKIKTKIVATEKVIVEKTDFRPLAKEYESQVRIISDPSLEKSGSKGTVEDFVDYFKDRYEQTGKILKTRGKNEFLTIENAKKKINSKIKIIGMIIEKKTTKNGHVLIRVEDPTSNINALIPFSNKPLLRASEHLVNDEVIALEGKISKELFIADEIYQPDIPLHETKKTEEDIAIAMLSDMHIGSKLFMKKNFENFLRWLRGEVGNERQRELASKVKYITIAGDICDGIGIYPGQEKELDIVDVYQQYAKLSEYIQQIPDYIHVVISPGDHDAVKKADPQNPLPPELVPELYKMKNITLAGNPTTVELHGLKTLVYHGVGFIDLIFPDPTLDWRHGAKAMIEMLKKRHLHPLYGGKPITPEKTDFLFIKEVPDIFHTGETHNNSYETYRGTLCINSGTWQNITDYIIKQGLQATPCILPIVEMKTSKINVMHFDKGI